MTKYSKADFTQQLSEDHCIVMQFWIYQKTVTLKREGRAMKRSEGPYDSCATIDA